MARFGCLDGPSHRAFGKNADGLQSLALLAMYHHLGCEDVTDFRSRLSTSGAPILLVKAECDPIADDNDLACSKYPTSCDPSFGAASTAWLFAILWCGSCGRGVHGADRGMDQQTHVRICFKNFKVAGPQRNRVGNLIPEDLYVQVGAR